MSRDTIEFYTKGEVSPFGSVATAMVPAVGSFISIDKETWTVVSVTYAVDYSNQPYHLRVMRACVEVKRSKPTRAAPETGKEKP